MATIRKRKDRYQVQIRRIGQPQVSKSFHELKDAKAWARLMPRPTQYRAIRKRTSMCKTFLSQKHDIVTPLYDRYKQARQHYDEIQKGSPLPVRALLTDLQTITPAKVPVELLERHVFEKISIQGKALIVMADLILSIDSLDKSFKLRNDLIEKYERTNFNSDQEKIEVYLGRRMRNGVLDERFRGNMEHMHTQIDNCIFFSRLLCDDLFEYATHIGNKNKRSYRLSFRKFEPHNWSIAEKSGLFPSNELFANYLKMFKKGETKLDRLDAWMRTPRPAPYFSPLSLCSPPG
jgi:hypothetical protein